MFSFFLHLRQLLVPTALAAGGGYIQGVVNGVIGGLPNGASGSAGFVGIADAIVVSYMPIIIPVAVLALGILGLRMVISQEDEIRQQSKNIIAAIISGVILANLISPFLSLVQGFNAPGAQANIVNSEVGGLIDWALGLLASFAVFFIVVTAFRIMAKGAIGISSEEDLGLLRRTIGGVAAGILVIVFKMAILSAFGGGGGPGPLLAAIARVSSYLLSFVALAAVAVIMYAGFRMVMNFGNEEAVTEGRSLILRVVAGLVLILTSLAIVQLVIGTVS